ncbi:tetratricopeptide repeat protein [Thermaerobacillus caldiproteolyticus]|uniref:tetratricopeptide repeat protein n=1 Tax=Thermaerobacillus caldiproteolyticus TaxID=247480 RepID=UPI0018F14FE4|nr:tetratricopeptide repeat protein [Anoxybacillus caldiproteolyticus]
MSVPLALAIKLRNEGHLEQSRELLLDLVKRYPNDGEIHFYCGQVHDSMGLEKEAVEFYEKAVRLGLKEESLKDAFVCLGSTYRVLGKYDESLEVLTKAQQQFPDYRPVQIFLALTLYSLKRYSEAMEIVLKNLIDTTDDEELHSYRRALKYYADHLE